MDLEFNKITLESGKIYYILLQIWVDEKKYYYAVSQENKEVLFCEIEEDSLKIVTDESLLEKLIKQGNRQFNLFYD